MKVKGINHSVFPLAKIDSLLTGYYMDSQGAVWSDRNGGGFPRILTGSKQPSGRYYTLANRSFRADDLILRCQSHAEWSVEIFGSIKPVVASPLVEKLEAHHGRTQSAAAAITKKSLVLATLGENDRLHFSSDPVYHDTLPQARTEAERVAQTTGKKVVVLQIVGAVQIQKANWE